MPLLNVFLTPERKWSPKTNITFSHSMMLTFSTSGSVDSQCALHPVGCLADAVYWLPLLYPVFSKFETKHTRNTLKMKSVDWVSWWWRRHPDKMVLGFTCKPLICAIRFRVELTMGICSGLWSVDKSMTAKLYVEDGGRDGLGCDWQRECHHSYHQGQWHLTIILHGLGHLHILPMFTQDPSIRDLSFIQTHQCHRVALSCTDH